MSKQTKPVMEFWVYSDDIDEFEIRHCCDFMQRGFIPTEKHGAIHVVEASALQAAEERIARHEKALEKCREQRNRWYDKAAGTSDYKELLQQNHELDQIQKGAADGEAKKG